MTLHFETKVYVFVALLTGIYETLLQFDNLLTLLTRWSIGILTVIYLIYQIKKLKIKKHG